MHRCIVHQLDARLRETSWQPQRSANSGRVETRMARAHLQGRLISGRLAGSPIEPLLRHQNEPYSQSRSQRCSLARHDARLAAPAAPAVNGFLAASQRSATRSTHPLHDEGPVQCPPCASLDDLLTPNGANRGADGSALRPNWAGLRSRSHRLPEWPSPTLHCAFSGSCGIETRNDEHCKLDPSASLSQANIPRAISALRRRQSSAFGCCSGQLADFRVQQQ